MASIVGAAGSLLSGILGGKGAQKAAQQQAAAIQKGIDEQRNEFAQTQANEAPYLQAGNSALGGNNGLLSLLGLSGNDAQSAAIAQLKASPQFTSQYNTGLDAINQSAAATGGLRGGNNALSESNFGAQLLNQVLGQQESNLGGLVQVGSGTANSLGQFGQQNASSLAALLSGQGNAQASGTLGQTNALTNAIKGISSSFGSTQGLSDLSSLFGNKTGADGSAVTGGSTGPSLADIFASMSSGGSYNSGGFRF